VHVQEEVGEFRIDGCPGGPPRSPGLHVTDVLRAIALKIGVFQEDDDEPTLKELLADGPENSGASKILCRIAAGLAWEDWIAKHYPELDYHFGEIVKDGMAGTPDAVLWLDDRPPIVHEFKLTWRTMRRAIQENWYWIHQLQIYCHLLDTLEAVLHIYYAMGNYGGSGPQYRIYRFRFEPEEIEATWRMLRNYAPRVVPGA
jgi:hypothetical protein